MGGGEGGCSVSLPLFFPFVFFFFFFSFFFYMQSVMEILFIMVYAIKGHTQFAAIVEFFQINLFI